MTVPMDTFDKYSQTMRKFDGSVQVNQYHTDFYGIHKELFDNIYEIAQTVSIGGEGYPKKKGGLMSQIPMTDYFYTAYYNQY